MMRELDTVSPVVWPSWCYSGEGQNEFETTGIPCENEKDSKGSDLVRESGGRTPSKSGQKRRNRSLMSLRYRLQNEDLNGETKTSDNKSDLSKEIEIKKENVKTERLSPVILGNTAGNADNNSNSSRSGTPSSSYPGTPPGGVSDSRERGSSPNSSSHIKQMEQMMMSRNYSDFMRSLAAKYNNTNPNDYFSASRNGFPQSLDPRFGAFKSGAATPFVGLMAPLSTAVSPSDGQSSAASSSGEGQKRPGKCRQGESFDSSFVSSGLDGSNPFGPAALFPPVIDMSSTQALLDMVRTATAQNRAQLENYLKNVHLASGKRRNETSPLDLSSAAAPSLSAKKVKQENVKDCFYDSILNLPLLDALRTKELSKLGTKSGSVSPSTLHKKNLQNSLNNLQNTISSLNARESPNRTVCSPKCSSVCGTDGRPCSDPEGRESVARWTVDDVCSFVGSIDVCAEYEKNFREERIDGASLSLLTEEHLTNSLGMKLGPALRLRALLARRLGRCAVCQHCIRCHGTSSSDSGASMDISIPVPSNNRPGSTGD